MNLLSQLHMQVTEIREQYLETYAQFTDQKEHLAASTLTGVSFQSVSLTIKALEDQLKGLVLEIDQVEKCINQLESTMSSATPTTH